MKKNLILLLGAGILTIGLLGGCGSTAENSNSTSSAEQMETLASQASSETAEAGEAEDATEGAEQSAENEITCPLEDGVYLADFKTDSSMFRVNEAKNGKGVLTVENGEMTIHVTLLSKKILNLYEGLAEDAAKEGAELLQPTTDMVTYSDGISEEVYGFDISVPYLEEEFDVALVGTKGSWYDHKVSVSNVEVYAAMEQTAKEESIAAEDGTYAAVTLLGGTGKATIESPATITYDGEQAYARLVWSSKNYDYMIADGVKYFNEAQTGEPSVFTIPVIIGEEMPVIGDTIAMSTPHEIEYTLLLELED